MNKKFSTLLAGVALLGSFSANAATFNQAVAQLKVGANSGLYQIKTDDGQFLSMNPDGTVSTVASVTSSTLANTLWCVTVDSQNQGQSLKFDFLNKGQGQYLDLSLVNLPVKETLYNVEVGGEIGGWAFSESLNPLEQGKQMFSYFTSDSIVGLQVDGGVLKAKKIHATTGDRSALTKFTLWSADKIVLNANEVNTILGNQKADAGVQLKFNPDVVGTTLTNPFNHDPFLAEESGTDGYLYVSNMDKSGYLRVDTTYTNEKGVLFLAYAWTGKDKENTALDAVKKSVINDQHKFQFVYYPSVDELEIFVEGVRYKASESDKTPFSKVSAESGWRVSLQDLIKDEVRILTVDKDEQNTVIKLGYGDCAEVSNDKTTIADGVYFIKNNKGEYLASPIYENGIVRWTAVNTDEQNPAHMPAYQWVILKNNTNDVTGISPVSINNREYPKNDYEGALNERTNVQLYKAQGANYYYVVNPLAGEDSLTFEAVPAASVTDPNLGYKKFAKDELMINKYTFNYWHPYADDKFIAQADKDSTLSVLEGTNRYFNIDTLVNTTSLNTVDIPYGYEVTKAVEARIKGLAQLNRTVYAISLNGSDWKVNKDDKFNVGAANAENIGNYYVFFKENNQFGDKCYHAIVKVMKEGTTYVIANSKAGVSDYDGAATLKNQVLAETRTSAFNIAPDETPLYRRFNSEKLEGHAGDGVDTLRFYEKYRNEYLMIENNSNFMVQGIDFLGIYTPDKANGGLAFQVDTAWVNRGYGHIKPQYLISIDRHDFAGVAGEPCTESGPHIDESGHITDDPYQCVHAHKAVPGFKRGKFLINFHNFADKNANKVNADSYKWAGYDRAGFKEAIVYKDTLYILRDEFKNLENEKIDFAAIKKADADAVKAGEASNIYSLLTDCHKYVTWSMRFYNRAVSANEVEADRAFLFESMNKSENANVEQWIAPSNAAWLKMQNGCLVLSDYTSSFDEVVTGGDDALIFNVEYVPGDEVAVDNENIAVEGVSVVAGNGQVTIMGAAGKNVTITNILGKVIANQTIASDNATIAVPAGIVAVAVEGEAAVKAIVK